MNTLQLPALSVVKVCQRRLKKRPGYRLALQFRIFVEAGLVFLAQKIQHKTGRTMEQWAIQWAVK